MTISGVSNNPSGGLQKLLILEGKPYFWYVTDTVNDDPHHVSVLAYLMYGDESFLEQEAAGWDQEFVNRINEEAESKGLKPLFGFYDTEHPERVVLYNTFDMDEGDLNTVRNLFPEAQDIVGSDNRIPLKQASGVKTANTFVGKFPGYEGARYDMYKGIPEIDSNFFISKGDCYWFKDNISPISAGAGAEQLLGWTEFEKQYWAGDLIYGVYQDIPRLSWVVNIKSVDRQPTKDQVLEVLEFFPEAVSMLWAGIRIEIEDFEDGFYPFIFVIAPDGRVARKDFATSGRADHAILAQSLGASRSEDELDNKGYGYVRGIVSKDYFFAAPGVMAPFSPEQAKALQELASTVDLTRVQDIIVEDSVMEYEERHLFNMPLNEPIPEPEEDFNFMEGCWVEVTGNSLGQEFFEEIYLVVNNHEEDGVKEYILYEPFDNDIISVPMTDQHMFTYQGYDLTALEEYRETGAISTSRAPKSASILSPVQEQRDPAIWEGDRLREEVKDFCFGVVEEYLEKFIAIEEMGDLLKRVLMIGSITGYQYDPDADLDVNLFVDLDSLSSKKGLDKELLLYEMRQEIRNVNGQLYPGTEHPVNLFLSSDEVLPPADGIYDMLEDRWLKIPGHPGDVDPYAQLKESIDRAEEVAEKVDAKWGAVKRTWEKMNRYPKSSLQIKRQLIRYLRSLRRILDNVVTERRDVFEMAKTEGVEPPQTSTPNVVYKYLEYNGLLDTLHTAEHAIEAYDETGELNLGLGQDPEILSEAPRMPSEPSLEDSGSLIPLAASRRLRSDSRSYKRSDFASEEYLDDDDYEIVEDYSLLTDELSDKPIPGVPNKFFVIDGTPYFWWADEDSIHPYVADAMQEEGILTDEANEWLAGAINLGPDDMEVQGEEIGPGEHWTYDMLTGDAVNTPDWILEQAGLTSTKTAGGYIDENNISMWENDNIDELEVYRFFISPEGQLYLWNSDADMMPTASLQERWDYVKNESVSANVRHSWGATIINHLGEPASDWLDEDKLFWDVMMNHQMSGDLAEQQKLVQAGWALGEIQDDQADLFIGEGTPAQNTVALEFLERWKSEGWEDINFEMSGEYHGDFPIDKAIAVLIGAE